MPKITALSHAQRAPEDAVLQVPAGASIAEARLGNGIEIAHDSES